MHSRFIERTERILQKRALKMEFWRNDLFFLFNCLIARIIKRNALKNLLFLLLLRKNNAPLNNLNSPFFMSEFVHLFKQYPLFRSFFKNLQNSTYNHALNSIYIVLKLMIDYFHDISKHLENCCLHLFFYGSFKMSKIKSKLFRFWSYAIYWR